MLFRLDNPARQNHIACPKVQGPAPVPAAHLSTQLSSTALAAPLIGIAFVRCALGTHVLRRAVLASVYSICLWCIHCCSLMPTATTCRMAPQSEPDRQVACLAHQGRGSTIGPSFKCTSVTMCTYCTIVKPVVLVHCRGWQVQPIHLPIDLHSGDVHIQSQGANACVSDDPSGPFTKAATALGTHPLPRRGQRQPLPAAQTSFIHLLPWWVVDDGVVVGIVVVVVVLVVAAAADLHIDGALNALVGLPAEQRAPVCAAVHQIVLPQAEC